MSLESFDPTGVGRTDLGLFGLPHTEEEADIVVLPVPWDVTTSYRPGTSGAPEAILAESPQLDLYHPDFPDLWKAGIFMPEISKDWLKKNETLRKLSEEIIKAYETGQKPNQDYINQINQASEDLNSYVYQQTKTYLDKNKIVGVLGGEHSVPLGFVKALSEKHESFGVLQIDAHLDLRPDYEGFIYSHASIMHHISKIPQVKKLVQVGIRDIDQFQENTDQIQVFYDKELKQALFKGKPWHDVCDEIINALPEKVYLSFDIDGLSPQHCPTTGTPVPGGLTYDMAVYLIERLAKSGRTIIGFDLVEVGASQLDAIIGSRLLFQLCGYTWVS